MFKKLLATALLVCTVPVLANAAWQLNTWTKSSGGTITSRNMAGQTVASGSIFKTYTTSATLPITVAANPGYSISSVIVNGVPAGLSGSYSVTGGAAQSLFATFQPALVAVGATAGPGGSVTPTSVANVYYGTKVSTPIVFRFIPKAGYAVTAISNPAGFPVSTGLPAAVGTTVTVTVPKDTVLTTPIALSGTFATTAAIANAGAAKNALVNTLVTLTGTGVNGTMQEWTQVSGPAVTLAGTNPVTFTPTVAGNYTFKYRIAASGSQAFATTNVVVAADNAGIVTQCTNCHSATNTDPLVAVGTTAAANWAAGGHNNAFHPAYCANCHVGANAGGHPGNVVGSCVACHAGPYDPATVDPGHSASTDCTSCHNNDSAHKASAGCIDCHSVNLKVAGNVNDNNGVRAIMGEFTKRSHHITGGTPTNAQCAVCHLEGKKGATPGTVVVDFNYHQKDANIYLRDVDSAAGAFVWNGSNHTAMDNFCFNCHDANGASDLTTLQGLIPAATASNPFADTLTNGYDLVARAGVVDVKTAFTTTNASHHAVSGQRYKYRFSTLANATAWATKNGKPVPAASEIAEGHTDLDGNPIPATAFDNSNGVGTGEAVGLDDRTLYEADKFVASYIPLGASANVADNSTLHCGDCHTVGQWKVASSTNADGTTTPVAIGAHGSANEYLLRNSLGTDALHNGLTIVCFNCHSNGTKVAMTDALWNEIVAEGEISSTVVKPTWRAGWNAFNPTIMFGQFEGGYSTAHAVSAFHGQCVADSADNVGATDRLAKSSRADKVKEYDYLPAPGATAVYPTGGSNATSGNITGIACTNCHNSGLRSGWGGIHGGNATYTDGMGRTQKSYRFMPGMGNYRYAPPGGWDGKDVTDAQLVTLPGAGVGAGKPMGGCYTNAATGDTNPGYSVCSHHGTSTAAIPPGILLAAPGPRTTYGGGSASNATAAEPTVREATAGGSLVTRPLKY